LTDNTTQAPNAPLPVIEQRTCRKCNLTKALIPTDWPHRPEKRTRTYIPHGNVCLACEKARKAEYEKRRDLIAAGIEPPQPPKASKETPEEQAKAIKAANKMDVARALKAGSQTLNEIAPSVLAKIMMLIEDEEHEQHQWALEFCANRIFPKRLYEELGAEAAGVGALGDKKPQFIINVLPATPQPHNEPRVIEGSHEIIVSTQQ
jgi:hypothetical protein